jgi:hypothetical protein
MPEERMAKKKVYKWKPLLRRLPGRPKNRWEDDIRNDMKKLKIKNWTNCIQDLISGNYMSRRPKQSKIEVVAPKEEEEEGLHVKYPLFFSGCNQAPKFSRQIFEKCSDIKLQENPSRTEVFPCGETGRHDEANSRFSRFCERV